MQVTKVLLIEGGVNGLITLSKMTVGMMTGSALVIADSMCLFTFLVGSIYAWLTVKMAK